MKIHNAERLRRVSRGIRDLLDREGVTSWGAMLLGNVLAYAGLEDLQTLDPCGSRQYDYLLARSFRHDEEDGEEWGFEEGEEYE